VIGRKPKATEGFGAVDGDDGDVGVDGDDF
jgi:hypothetical protein